MPRNDSTEVKRIQYARPYILKMIRGYLMPDLSRNLIHLRWLLKLVDFKAEVVYHYYNHELSFAFHFYVIE
ncbi:hypothetical protein Goshw_004816 [Gossypium schwendimanii]|uniref:Uncharacterized protein n=1 Tax=Gossypium schwendimanii TaxID=34291 RepID=A0A7J9N2G2_GOSSC|nr:hypothetical protein [Gossypium schwendimanii]